MSMESEQEIVHIGKQLERIANSDTPNDEQALDILKSLQGLPMTLEVLQKSRVGLSVNKLRKKFDGSELASVSKKLIKSWKKLLAASPKESPTSQKKHSSHKAHPHHSHPVPPLQIPTSPMTSEPPSPPPVLYSPPSQLSSSQDTKENSAGSKNGSTKSPDLPNGEIPILEGSSYSGGISGSPGVAALPFSPSVDGNTRVSPAGDGVRDRCRDMIIKALKKGLDEVTIEDEIKFYNLSASVEECIFSEFRSTGDKYKKCVRSRVSNLGDLKNPGLRQKVIAGEISPLRIAAMSTEEMASDDMKQLRQKITKDAIRDAQIAVGGGTPTDLLKCSRCKGRKCTYTQAQTRSADEPMTTFAYCNDCGHRWKFC